MERKEAIEVIKKNWPDKSFKKLREALETLAPELKESDDETIRKALIDGFTVMKESKNCGKTFSKYNIPVADILAYLEKQGEQNPVVTPKFKVGDTIKELETGNLFYVNSIEDFGYTLHYKNCNANGCTMSFKYEDKYELVEQKPADKVEPKFKVGDWIVSDDKDVHDDYRVCKITKIVDGRYYIEDGDFLSESSLALYGYRLWTIQDAKSLRPQNRWKPSDEQMEQLHKYCPDNRPLTSLYEQLKKLRGE